MSQCRCGTAFLLLAGFRGAAADFRNPIMERYRITMKRCSQCGNDRPATLYHITRKNGNHWIRGICPWCVKENSRAWRLNNPNPSKAYGLRAKTRKCGITVEDYTRMFAEQDGRCAICGKPETKTRGGVAVRLSIDHDHVTGKARGLLCNNCNVMIGYANDDIVKLRAAVVYLSCYQPVVRRRIQGGL